MIGPARVIAIPEATEIGEKDLAVRGIKQGERILLKTSNSAPCRQGRRVRAGVRPPHTIPTVHVRMRPGGPTCLDVEKHDLADRLGMAGP